MPVWARFVARAAYCARTVLTVPQPLALEFSTRAWVPHRSVHGIWVGVVDTHKSKREEVWARLERVLALIEQVDARRHNRLCRDVRRILVVPRAADYLMPYTGTCYVSLRKLIDSGDARIASDLVHEATHARQLRAGLRYWPDLQKRMEEHCIRQQMDFESKLPRAGYIMGDRWRSAWEEVLRTYPATKGGRVYRWLSRRYSPSPSVGAVRRPRDSNGVAGAALGIWLTGSLVAATIAYALVFRRLGRDLVPVARSGAIFGFVGGAVYPLMYRHRRAGRTLDEVRRGALAGMASAAVWVLPVVGWRLFRAPRPAVGLESATVGVTLLAWGMVLGVVTALWVRISAPGAALSDRSHADEREGGSPRSGHRA